MSEGSDGPLLILHAFADQGVESEALSAYGRVIRIGHRVRDTNESEPIRAVISSGEDDSDDSIVKFPISPDVRFDLAFMHPPCTKWADTTSISGDPEDHIDLIPEARQLAREYADHYVIENKPRAPLEDPVRLTGEMFGLPIKYERAFETSFPVDQPPRQQKLAETETSPFFYTERPPLWWKSVKGVSGDYPKEHLAKNGLPAPYVHYLMRHFVLFWEEQNGVAEDRPDYSDYDEEMETKRREDLNSSLLDFSSTTDDE